MFNLLRKFYDAGLLGSIIGGAGSIVGDVASLFGQSAANRQAENYQNNVLQEQRQWALTDINNQNAYNSPSQQMARLKAAGLNPNLVYGAGVQGATGNQSSQPRAVSSPTYTPQNPEASFSNVGKQLSDAISTGQNINSTNAQIDQTRAAIDNMRKDGILKDLDAVKMKFQNNILSTEPGADAKDDASLGDDKFQDLNRRLSMSQPEWDKKQADASIAQVNAGIAAATQESSITQGLQAGIQAMIKTGMDSTRAKNLITLGDQMKNDIHLQNLDIQMQEGAFNSKSPIIQQVFNTIFGLLGGAIGSRLGIAPNYNTINANQSRSLDIRNSHLDLENSKYWDK